MFSPGHSGGSLGSQEIPSCREMLGSPFWFLAEVPVLSPHGMQRGLLLAATWQQAIGHVWDAFLGPSALSPLAMFPRFPLKSILCYSDVLYLSTVLQRNDDPRQDEPAQPQLNRLSCQQAWSLCSIESSQFPKQILIFIAAGQSAVPGFLDSYPKQLLSYRASAFSCNPWPCFGCLNSGEHDLNCYQKVPTPKPAISS